MHIFYFMDVGVVQFDEFSGDENACDLLFYYCIPMSLYLENGRLLGFLLV